MDESELKTRLDEAIALARKHKECLFIRIDRGDKKYCETYHNDVTGWTYLIIHGPDVFEIGCSLETLGIKMKGADWKKIHLDEKRFIKRFEADKSKREEIENLKSELERTKLELERVKLELERVKLDVEKTMKEDVDDAKSIEKLAAEKFVLELELIKRSMTHRNLY